MKVCKSCLIKKSEDCFYKSKSGLRGSCKDCYSKECKDRYKSKKIFVGCNKKNLPLPKQSRLKELFTYDNGKLVRNISVGNSAAGKVIIGKLEKSGYYRMNIDGNSYLTHRVIWKLLKGTEPEFIDHIDQNRINNKIENLRQCTKNENARHQLTPKNNTTGYIGVSFIRSEKYTGYVASISFDGKKKNVRVKNVLEGVLKYNEMAKKYHGKYAESKIKRNIEQLKRDGYI